MRRLRLWVADRSVLIAFLSDSQESARRNKVLLDAARARICELEAQNRRLTALCDFEQWDKEIG